LTRLVGYKDLIARTTYFNDIMTISVNKEFI
jgi:hypothetical protein